MAGEGKARPNKQMTITFTLPISCQICLGKVKQPVLCPNSHVFCNLCLEIWLRKNSQCPACRVDIGPDNPVKHIIGGNIEDEGCATQSSPEIRRARFDLLYQEYEDHLEKLQKENLILRTENNILIAQLKDAEDKNESDKGEKKSSVSTSSVQTSDGPSLHMLTKSLQEAQHLYMGIKADMSQLKQENGKLKDENVHLTRENESLRLEIAQRSPKKFGRYTVATLETQISEQEKEIRQLKKALERSDSYIEELQRQRETPDNVQGKTHKVEIASKPRFMINMEPKRSPSVKNSLFQIDPMVPADVPRKVLFGKIVPQTNQKINVFSSTIGSKSLHMQHSVKTFSRSNVDKADNGADSRYHESNSDCNLGPPISGHSAQHHPESIIKSGGILESEHYSKEADSGGHQEHTSKKVHFHILGQYSDASSFDLEMPSPASSLVSESPASLNKEILPPTHKSSQAGPSSKNDTQIRVGHVAFSDLGENLNLLKGNTVSQTSGKTLGKMKKIKTSDAAKEAKQLPHDTNNSSHLSFPCNLNDTNDLSEHANDLDISMTPEMTDCLQLMSQAEKKMSLPFPLAGSSSGTSFPAASATSSSSVTLPVYQSPFSFTFPLNVPISTRNYGQGFAPSASSIRGWEQEFYNALKVNPYKFTSSNNPHDFTAANKQNPLTNDLYKAVGGSHPVHSSVDLNPTKEVLEKDFKFSDPIKVSLPISYRASSTVKFSDIKHTVDKDYFKPFNLSHRFPSSSTTTPLYPISSSSLACSFTASTSVAHEGNSYPSSSVASAELSSLLELNSSETQTGKFTSNLSSSVLEFPSKSPQYTKENEIAPSMSPSSSGLEWPEDNLDSDHQSKCTP